MCFFSSPKTPDPPEPPEPPKAPKETTAVTKEAIAAQTQKVKKYAGQQSTIMTGPSGMTTKAATTQKKLLGQ